MNKTLKHLFMFYFCVTSTLLPFSVILTHGDSNLNIHYELNFQKPEHKSGVICARYMLNNLIGPVHIKTHTNIHVTTG